MKKQLVSVRRPIAEVEVIPGLLSCLPRQPYALVTEIARDDNGDPTGPHRDWNVVDDDRHAKQDT
jgi:hypothetical protein